MFRSTSVSMSAFASKSASRYGSTSGSASLTRVRGAAVAVLLLGALSVSCGASDKGDDRSAGSTASSGATVTAAPTDSAPATATATGDATGTAAPTEDGTTAPAATPDATPSATRSEPVSLVRDAFAGLQATLNESCTPDNCAYFLGRVYDELHRLDRAMKADAKGPGHFPEPIQLIAKLDTELDGDRSFENLKKHQHLLLGTRDKINTWMQGHPDDYR
ncbi:hypothetical protein ACFV5J_00385 [Streptomyces zaomyceticus]|uniref:hypothetical protein n=1 Tax=Streptomyces zaomyceticus TaxID=68286 RepID=UPI00365E1C88